MTVSRDIPLETEWMIGHIDGHVVWMVFKNPERRNAVTSDMWAAMAAIMEVFEADPAVRIIVLRGAGEKAFVSGADISQFERQRSSSETVPAYDAVAGRAQKLLTDSHKPTIAMIQGYCIGGGLGIAVGCGLRIAATGSKFGVPAARLAPRLRRGGCQEIARSRRSRVHSRDLLHGPSPLGRGGTDDGPGQSRCAGS